jgi:pimeloyl-ACP methyl ester carboxylesterase
VENCETHDPNGIIACLRGMMEREDSCQVLKTMKQPAFLFFGEDDNFIPSETAADLLKRFPNADGAIIPKCGHNSFIEQPEKVLELLEAFLDKNFTSR